MFPIGEFLICVSFQLHMAFTAPALFISSAGPGSTNVVRDSFQESSSALTLLSLILSRAIDFNVSSVLVARGFQVLFAFLYQFRSGSWCCDDNQRGYRLTQYVAPQVVIILIIPVLPNYRDLVFGIKTVFKCTSFTPLQLQR